MNLNKKQAYKKTIKTPVIGVDEAGRGPLAGPVFAGAVILKNSSLDYVDSKTLSPKKRKFLFQQILKETLCAVGKASVKEIEDLNILHASLLAMRRAVEQLKLKQGLILIDGPFIIPGLPDSFQQKAVVKGDKKIPAVSAASIIAKVTRDEWMTKQDKKHPGYNFAKHKGYGTKEHLQALKKLGPCPLHRKSFAGLN